MEPMAASLTADDVHAHAEPTDVRSFEELFAAESPVMLRLAVRLVDVPERAEEIVQDAFEKTLLAWHRVREPGAFVRTAVVNGCRSELRRRRVVRRHPLPAAGTADLGESDSSLLDAVERLTPQRRIAITLRYYADLPEAEIAAAMGVRPGTVKSLISRALADLRASDLRRLQP
jgi:RNA polymerase sigma factor (sigma-70 family)